MIGAERSRISLEVALIRLFDCSFVMMSRAAKVAAIQAILQTQLEDNDDSEEQLVSAMDDDEDAINDSGQSDSAHPTIPNVDVGRDEDDDILDVSDLVDFDNVESDDDVSDENSESLTENIFTSPSGLQWTQNECLSI